MLSTYLISALCIGALASAHPLDERSYGRPTPTRPFTAKAFQSPYPTGQGLTGLELHAQNGAFFLNSATPKAPTVLSVNGLGNCDLTGVVPSSAKVFIDPSDGHLGYSRPGKADPAGAVVVNFLHLGKGTDVYTVRNNYTAPPPGTFQWIGSDNSYWFACPSGGAGYQVYKQVNYVGPPDLNACTVLQLAAIDYAG